MNPLEKAGTEIRFTDKMAQDPLADLNGSPEEIRTESHWQNYIYVE